MIADYLKEFKSLILVQDGNAYASYKLTAADVEAYTSFERSVFDELKEQARNSKDVAFETTDPVAKQFNQARPGRVSVANFGDSVEVELKHVEVLSLVEFKGIEIDTSVMEYEPTEVDQLNGRKPWTNVVISARFGPVRTRPKSGGWTDWQNDLHGQQRIYQFSAGGSSRFDDGCVYDRKTESREIKYAKKDLRRREDYPELLTPLERLAIVTVKKIIATQFIPVDPRLLQP